MPNETPRSDTGFLRQAWRPDNVDETDIAIISALQQDGRASYRQIADNVGMSQATVRKRIERLLQDGLIQVVAIPNAFASGRTLMAMANIVVSGDIDQVGRTIAEWPEVTWLMSGAGHTDLVAEFACVGTEALYTILKRIRQVEGVQIVHSFIYLRPFKQLYVGPLST